MPDINEEATVEKQVALRRLSREAVLKALDNEDAVVVEAATELIQMYTDKAAAVLQDGGDYLPVLTPGAAHSPLEAVAMEMVREAFDEEMEDL